MEYRDFRKAINYIFTPGGVASFYGVIGDDGVRREAVEVKFSKTHSGNIEEYTVRVNQEVLKYLDKETEDVGKDLDLPFLGEED